MKMPIRIAFGALVLLCVAGVLKLVIGEELAALFVPHGEVAIQQRKVIVVMTGIMLVLAVPMLVLLYVFAWKYRAGNADTDAEYDPERRGGAAAQLLLWAIPASFVALLWIITWDSTHALDPYKPIVSEKPPVKVQVIALRWKWLFIYPEQGIATVNELTFPADTPVHFHLTADGPVSSFWIPQLGSQIYAMGAMTTQLHLIGKPGEYVGRNTEINGEGYSGMTFTAKAVSQDAFDEWVRSVRQGTTRLDRDAYAALAAPSEYVPPSSYASTDPELFDYVVMRDMMPPGTDGHGSDMQHMHHDMPGM